MIGIGSVGLDVEFRITVFVVVGKLGFFIHSAGWRFIFIVMILQLQVFAIQHWWLDLHIHSIRSILHLIRLVISDFIHLLFIRQLILLVDLLQQIVLLIIAFRLWWRRWLALFKSHIYFLSLLHRSLLQLLVALVQNRNELLQPGQNYLSFIFYVATPSSYSFRASASSPWASLLHSLSPSPKTSWVQIYPSPASTNPFWFFSREAGGLS